MENPMPSNEKPDRHAPIGRLPVVTHRPEPDEGDLAEEIEAINRDPEELKRRWAEIDARYAKERAEQAEQGDQADDDGAGGSSDCTS